MATTREHGIGMPKGGPDSAEDKVCTLQDRTPVEWAQYVADSRETHESAAIKRIGIEPRSSGCSVTFPTKRFRGAGQGQVTRTIVPIPLLPHQTGSETATHELEEKD